MKKLFAILVIMTGFMFTDLSAQSCCTTTEQCKPVECCPTQTDCCKSTSFFSRLFGKADSKDKTGSQNSANTSAVADQATGEAIVEEKNVTAAVRNEE